MLNLYDFDYGMTAQIELPWKFQLATDVTNYARLSRTFCKGKLVCMLDGFDLLGHLSNVRRTINA